MPLKRRSPVDSRKRTALADAREKERISLRRAVRRDVGWNVPTLITGKAVAIVVAIVVTRLVGVSGYGLWVQVQVAAQLLSLPIGLGTYQAIVQLHPSAVREGRGGDVVWTSLWLVGGVGTLCAAIGVLFGQHLGSLFDAGSSGSAFRLVGVLATTNAVSLTLRSAFRAQNDLRSFAVTGLASDVTELVSVLIFSVAGASVAGIVLAGAAGSTALCLTMIVLLVRRIGPMTRPTSAAREIVRYGAPLIVTQLSDDVLARGDRLVVGAILGPAATGLYSMVYALVSLPNLVLRALSDVIFPKITSRQWSTAATNSLTGRSMVISAVLCLSTTATLALVGPWAVATMLGEDIHGISDAGLRVLIIATGVGTLCFGLGRLGSLPLFAAGRTGLVAVVWTGCAVLNIVFNLALLPAFGLVGAGFANAAAYLVFFIALDRGRQRVVCTETIAEKMSI